MFTTRSEVSAFSHVRYHYSRPCWGLDLEAFNFWMTKAKCFMTQIVIVITFYSPSCLNQGQRRDLSVFESSFHLPICLPHTMEASHCPCNCWTSSREAVKSNFYSLWFDPTGNQTHVYRFSSRRSIHSTTDPNKICNTINHYFANIGNEIAPPVLVEKETTVIPAE